MASSKKAHSKTTLSEGVEGSHAVHAEAPQAGHEAGGQGPAEALPDPAELAASAAARRAVARLARPVGLAVAVAGAGLSLGLAGRGDLAAAAVPLVLAVHGAAVASVARELRRD